MELKDKYVILEKLDGKNNQSIRIGGKDVQGYCLHEPKIGEQFMLYNSPIDVVIGSAIIPKEDLLVAYTSQVREVDLDNNIIKTANSTYKITLS